MKISTMKKHTLTEYTRIGNVIPRNKLTLLTGLPGTGKSFTLLKFLNKENIKPILFNLDEDPELNKMDIISIDPVHLPNLIAGDITDLKGHVIIIDTYQRMYELLSPNGNTEAFQIKITTKLLNLCDTEDCTIIVIGHPEDYVGKASIFKDNQTLVRNAHEHIHFDCILPTGKNRADVLYRMFIKKGRGIGGTQMFDNWLRD